MPISFESYIADDIFKIGFQVEKNKATWSRLQKYRQPQSDRKEIFSPDFCTSVPKGLLLLFLHIFRKQFIYLMKPSKWKYFPYLFTILFVLLESHLYGYFTGQIFVLHLLLDWGKELKWNFLLEYNCPWNIFSLK